MLSQWAPAFSVRMGIPPHRLADLTVPELVDHMDYLEAMNKG